MLSHSEGTRSLNNRCHVNKHLMLHIGQYYNGNHGNSKHIFPLHHMTSANDRYSLGSHEITIATSEQLLMDIPPIVIIVTTLPW